MGSPKRMIAITMGDPAGIGPEICLQAANSDPLADCASVIFGDAELLRHVAQRCRLRLPPATDTLRQAAELAVHHSAVILDLPTLKGTVQPGHVTASTGAAAYRYIEVAIEAALGGEVAAVATGPIHKEALHEAGVPYPGHIEIFAALTRSDRACMMLTSRELSCSFVTTHVGYHEVPSLLSQQRIFDVIDTNTRSLPSDVAASIVERVAEEVQRACPDLIFKKIDSLLRGPVLAEQLATCRSLKLARCLLVNANPRKGRTVRDGCLFIDGQPESAVHCRQREFVLATPNRQRTCCISQDLGWIPRCWQEPPSSLKQSWRLDSTGNQIGIGPRFNSPRTR